MNCIPELFAGCNLYLSCRREVHNIADIAHDSRKVVELACAELEIDDDFWENRRCSSGVRTNFTTRAVHYESKGIMITESIASISPVSLAIALVFILLAVVYYNLKNKELPPGPVGLPYIGYWPFLNNQTCNQHMMDLKKKYGDVFCFTSAGRLYVNLGSFKAIREAHINKADFFGGRYKDFNLLSYVFEDGVGFLNGEPWKELRKFFLQVLKERGVISVKDSMSGSMYDAIKSTVDEIKAMKDEPINMVELVTNKCNAILRNMLFSENGMSEEQIREVNECYSSVMECMTTTNLLLTGDFARYCIFPFMKGFKSAMNNNKNVEKVLYNVIDVHKSTYNEDHMRDIIDDYFKERDNRRSKGDPTAQYFTGN
ncbi:cytochrome P450 2B12 [Trichonephila clavipes]|nr:cytochrome P450 2B12 [Trichonephila clavipes]